MNIAIPKGIIALDIDGTLTKERYAVSPQVIDYLSFLAHEGWKIIFITGRPFHWSYQTLQHMPFTYILAVQNGSLVMELPSKEIILRKYLKKEIIYPLSKACSQFGTDFIIYSGYENGDICYYRPTKMSPTLLDYVQRRSTALGERYQAVESFGELPVDVFSSVKCFADESQAYELGTELENLSLHAPP